MTHPTSLAADKYWICNVCALKNDLKPFKSAYTVIQGICGWCEVDEKVTLTPIRDLKNSNGKSGYVLLDEKAGM